LLSVPNLALVHIEIFDPGATYITDELLTVLDISKSIRFLLLFLEGRLIFVDHALNFVEGFSFSIKENARFYFICFIFNLQQPIHTDCACTPYHASHSTGRTVELQLLSILKTKVICSRVLHKNVVRLSFYLELIITPECVQIIRIFNEHIGNWWVVRSVLCIIASSVLEVGLKGFSNEGIEGFVQMKEGLESRGYEAHGADDPLNRIRLLCSIF